MTRVFTRHWQSSRYCSTRNSFSMELSIILLVLVLILTLTYYFLTWSYSHWQKQNVPCMPDPVPGLGHMWPLITLKENIGLFATRLYNSTDASMIGFYTIQRPSLLVRDPELVKSVLQTNFLSFSSNFLQLSEKQDPVLSKNPFFVNELAKWKEMRSRTGNNLSGKRLRYLFRVVQRVSSQLVDFIDRRIDEHGEYAECEMKELFTRATGEIVANAAFGIEGQSFEDNPEPLAFTNAAKNVFTPSFVNGIKQALLFFLPGIANFLGTNFLAKSTDRYFRESLRLIIEQRKKMANPPDDYLQAFIDNNDLNDLDSVVAEAIIFYGDVYETSSSALASIFYLLSQNPEVQDKLHEHIRSVVEPTKGELVYESLKELTYLDQVIQESLRLISPVGALSKVCAEEITLTGSDGLTCRVQPGNPIFIPVESLHSDEKYWPEPERFDPDRFTPENQAARQKYVHLAFGEGPRMCVGQRMANMLLKATTSALLMKYSVESSPKTRRPLEYSSQSFLNYVKGGLWARFTKLNN